MKRSSSLVLVYIYLAVSCAALGSLITFGLIVLVQYYKIDFWDNPWLLAIPITLSVLLNVLLIELYHKFRKR
jgi:hypothetical protein